MKRVEVRSKPAVANFYVGENRLVNIPKLKFQSSSYAIRDPLINFCNETILRVFENLLLNRIMAADIGVSTVTYLGIFTRKKTHVVFRIEGPVPENCGLIEEAICKIIQEKNQIPAPDLVYGLIGQLIKAKTDFTNPWREVLRNMIEENRLTAWSFTLQQYWFRSVKIDINPSSMQSLGNTARAIEESWSLAKAGNDDLRLLSDYLLKEIDRWIRAFRESD